MALLINSLASTEVAVYAGYVTIDTSPSERLTSVRVLSERSLLQF